MANWVRKCLKMLWITGLALGLTIAECLLNEDSVALAGPSAPSVADWMSPFYQLVTEVPLRGQRRDTQDYVTFHLKVLSNTDEQAERDARYLTLFGGASANGSYQPTFLSQVEEQWRKRPEGGWLVAQKILVVDLYGQVTQIYRQNLKMTFNRLVEGAETLPSGSLEQETADFRAGLTNWVQVLKAQ